MLNIRQNFVETIKGGNPDRFVKQYEFMEMIVEAMFTLQGVPRPGGTGEDGWGVAWSFPEGQIGPFPMHDDEHKLLKDITQWKEVVKAPAIPDDDLWAPAVAHAATVDRKQKYVTASVAPGVFERVHHMMGMEDALIALYEEPEAMHELIEYITDYEVAYAQKTIEMIKPDALFHHDDWGSSLNSFLSPDMFEEFILPAYMKIYGFYKANGVEIIVHHSDSYAANLVPFMIEMGIDIWQGLVPSNDIAALIQKYGDKITFMGGIESAVIDNPDWTPQKIAEQVGKACKEYGTRAYIPCHTQGGPRSTNPGVYDEVNRVIDKMSQEMF